LLRHRRSGTLLTCSSSSTTPIPAGTSLGSVSAKIDIPELASGSLQVTVALVDAADGTAPSGAVEAMNVPSQHRLTALLWVVVRFLQRIWRHLHLSRVSQQCR